MCSHWLLSVSGERDGRVGVGGGALCQTHLPVSISRDSDQVDAALIVAAVTSSLSTECLYTFLEEPAENEGTSGEDYGTTTLDQNHDFYFESLKKQETWNQWVGGSNPLMTLIP